MTEIKISLKQGTLEYSTHKILTGERNSLKEFRKTFEELYGKIQQTIVDENDALLEYARTNYPIDTKIKNSAGEMIQLSGIYEISEDSTYIKDSVKNVVIFSLGDWIKPVKDEA